MLNTAKMPKQVEILDDLTFSLVVHEMPTVCIFGALWCDDTERLMTQSLPLMIDKYDWIIRFCFVIIQRRANDKILCPGIKRLFGISRYPSITGFVKGRMLDCGLVVSDGSVDSQLQDLEAICTLVSA